ncbi:hypothetical protein GCM10010301_05460 [Streptomyces plicatus]|nr:hypothetical protein GCM10010301_05460 [Streptomyces plicatus]
MARWATGLAATVGAFLGGAGSSRPYVLYVHPFVRSYECFAPRDTGKSTKRPTVSNDTGTPDGPLGTGAWPEGSVCVEPDGNVARASRVHRSGPLVRPFLTAKIAKGKTLT